MVSLIAAVYEFRETLWAYLFESLDLVGILRNPQGPSSKPEGPFKNPWIFRRIPRNPLKPFRALGAKIIEIKMIFFSHFWQTHPPTTSKWFSNWIVLFKFGPIWNTKNKATQRCPQTPVMILSNLLQDGPLPRPLLPLPQRLSPPLLQLLCGTVPTFITTSGFLQSGSALRMCSLIENAQTLEVAQVVQCWLSRYHFYM